MPDIATQISQDAIDLIIADEVSSPQLYQKLYQHPTWPGGGSGVTIGIGYDIGEQKSATFVTDWTGILGDADIKTLAVACGVKGDPAKPLTAQLKGVAVTWEQASENFKDRVLPSYVALTRRSLPNTDALAPECLGALVSLVYNRGAGGFTATGDRYAEMRAIKNHMTSTLFEAIPADFRSMKRLWADNPSTAGLVKRREDEAVLFEKGLAKMG